MTWEIAPADGLEVEEEAEDDVPVEVDELLAEVVVWRVADEDAVVVVDGLVRAYEAPMTKMTTTATAAAACRVEAPFRMLSAFVSASAHKGVGAAFWPLASADPYSKPRLTAAMLRGMYEALRPTRNFANTSLIFASSSSSPVTAR